MSDLSEESKRLLALSAGADEPSAADKARTKRALFAGLAAGGAVGVTSSTAVASGASAAIGTGAAIGAGTAVAAGGTHVAVWLGAGLVIGLGVAGVAATLTRPAGLSAPPAASVSAPPGASVSAPPAPLRATVRREATGAVAAMSDPPSPAGEVVPADAARRNAGVVLPGFSKANSRSPSPALAPTSASSIRAETALLEAAHAALGRGDARGALTLLDEHAREFPDGALTEERLASRVFALCGLGRHDDAAVAARDLLQRAPASPLRARVLDSCAFSK